MIQQLFRSQQHSERQGIYGMIPTYMLWKIKRENYIHVDTSYISLPCGQRKSFEPLGEIRNLNKSFCHAIAERTL